MLRYAPLFIATTLVTGACQPVRADTVTAFIPAKHARACALFQTKGNGDRWFAVLGNDPKAASIQGAFLSKSAHFNARLPMGTSCDYVGDLATTIFAPPPKPSNNSVTPKVTPNSAVTFDGNTCTQTPQPWNPQQGHTLFLSFWEAPIQPAPSGQSDVLWVYDGYQQVGPSQVPVTIAYVIEEEAIGIDDRYVLAGSK